MLSVNVALLPLYYCKYYALGQTFSSFNPNTIFQNTGIFLSGRMFALFFSFFFNDNFEKLADWACLLYLYRNACFWRALSAPFWHFAVQRFRTMEISSIPIYYWFLYFTCRTLVLRLPRSPWLLPINVKNNFVETVQILIGKIRLFAGVDCFRLIVSMWI